MSVLSINVWAKGMFWHHTALAMLRSVMALVSLLIVALCDGSSAAGILRSVSRALAAATLLAAFNALQRAVGVREDMSTVASTLEMWCL
eukprot:7494361-Pyramimonas_sp.AAC.1